MQINKKILKYLGNELKLDFQEVDKSTVESGDLCQAYQ